MPKTHSCDVVTLIRQSFLVKAQEPALTGTERAKSNRFSLVRGLGLTTAFALDHEAAKKVTETRFNLS